MELVEFVGEMLDARHGVRGTKGESIDEHFTRERRKCSRARRMKPSSELLLRFYHSGIH